MRGDKTFAYDLIVRYGPVSCRVALLLRSAEGKPPSTSFQHPHPSPPVRSVKRVLRVFFVKGRCRVTLPCFVSDRGGNGASPKLWAVRSNGKGLSMRYTVYSCSLYSTKALRRVMNKQTNKTVGCSCVARWGFTLQLCRGYPAGSTLANIVYKNAGSPLRWWLPCSCTVVTPISLSR